MTVTVNTFRRDFIEFSDSTDYANSTISYYLTLAGKLMDTNRWGDLYDDGVNLFIAHNIALERRAIQTAANDGIPGQSGGITSSKSVDKVSISYDTASAAELDAGHWNLTIYGTRYIRLARMIGMGPVQIGACGATSPLSSSAAWPGPWVFNSPNPQE